jgi:hypothetical protein
LVELKWKEGGGYCNLVWFNTSIYGGEGNRGEHNFSALNFGFPPILVGFGGGENISLKYFIYID